MPRHAPDPIRLPDKVWHDPAVLNLCRHHDGNGLLRLARKYGNTNESIGYWTGLDPAEISKRTSPTGTKANSPITSLDRWQRIADALAMPDHARAAIGLAPRSAEGEGLGEDGDMQRRTVLRGAVIGVGLGVVVDRSAGRAGFDSPDDSAILMENGCAEWLAWQMWQRRVDRLHVSELPAPIARYLNAGSVLPVRRVLSPGGMIVCDVGGTVAFVRPGDADLFVGHRVFRDIAGGSSRLLGSGQTTHQTDLVLQQYVGQHETSLRMLREWSRKSSDSVVRVNSAGILAKLGRDDLVDEVAVSLTEHVGARNLYVTAVVSRVLDRAWSASEALAAKLDDPGAVSAALSADDLARMASELGNGRDGVARWCAAVIIGAHGAPPDAVRTSLRRALLTERSRENLRAIGTALSGSTPVAN